MPPPPSSFSVSTLNHVLTPIHRESMQSCNTDVGLSPQCSKGFFFAPSQLSVQTLTVSVQLQCAIACISSCAHFKHPKHWQPYNCLDTQKYCTDILHTLIGMGSAALAATVPYPGKMTRISRKGQRSNTYLLFTDQATGMYVRKVPVTRDTQLLFSST